MGSGSSKFKKYLQHGDEFAAMQVYQNSPDLRENLDPNASYGESHNHYTPLHYAAKHGMKHLVRAFLYEHGGNPNKCSGEDESSIHCVCKVGLFKSPSAEERRTMCMSIMLTWRGALLQDGEKEKPQLNAQDKKGNTPLHYACTSGLQKCVELLVFQGAWLFIENNDKMTPCDMAVKAGHHDVASFLEMRMVFADTLDMVNEVEFQNNILEVESDEADSDVYAGLRAQDLQEAKDQLLVETADMLHIPLFTAEALLRDNEWSKTLLLEKWMSNAIQCCEMAGIAPPNSALQIFAPSPPVGNPASSPLSTIITPPPAHAQQDQEIFDPIIGQKNILCEICFGEMSPWDLGADGPSCGHRFCMSCWESYLTLKIEEGSTHHILCPAVGCNILVDVDFIEKMVSPQVARKYLQFDIEAFVERNKTIKWCPLPGCGRAVRFPEAELITQPFHIPNMSPPPKTSHAVDCGNGHYFCWECLGEAHSPCGCDQWFDWQGKVAEVRPEELRISSGETEDAANFLWLVTNSKPCPNCKSPIQKNEGCNHMKCSKCKFVFCWVCLESWKKHSSATGGYFRCNRYSAQGKADEKIGALISEASVRNQEMQELSRFIHYYTRFKNHQNSLKLEEPLMRLAKAKMEAFANSFVPKEAGKKTMKDSGTKFIEEGIKELLKARRVLCGSYVYGYYLQDNGYNKPIFEFMQNELEQKVEKLSEMIVRQYLVTPRGEIIATTLLVRKRRHKFVRAVGRGLFPPETPPSLRKGRRSIPTFIGMDHTEDESNLNQALTLLGKCNRKSCPQPRARNTRTGLIHDFCSIRCTQQTNFLPNQAKVASEKCINAWEGCDSNMELLIALEMSRLQMIEDEARRRQSWLRERSQEHGWTSSQGQVKEQLFWSQMLPHHLTPGCDETHATATSSDYITSLNNEQERYTSTHGFPPNFFRHPYGIPCSSGNQHQHSMHQHCETNYSWNGSQMGTVNGQLSSAEIAVDYFLKKMANSEISSRNLNVDREPDYKIEKDLICFLKKPPHSEDGRFKYGDIHENGHLSFLPVSDVRRDLRRSQSLGDLTDRSSDLELMLDSDHIHQDYPEAPSKLLLSRPRNNHRNSLAVDSESGGDVEWTDQGIRSDVIEDNSPMTDLEVRGILNHLDNETISVASVASQTEPSFQFYLDEGTDKDESNSTERSTSSLTQGKASSLRIHISHPNKLEPQSSNEFESEMGIPNSPTLYISGVSISRSPEPRSPKSLTAKETRSPTHLPLCCTPEPRINSRLESSPIPIYTRSRSSSLIVPSTKTSSAQMDPSVAYSGSKRISRADRECFHLSSLSLQATRASSPFMNELRVSRSASEPEKGHLVFQFPKSPTEGALSSVLHVEESTLSSDDFHEALFLSKSPKASKRKKSKRERNKDKDPREKTSKSEEKKDKPKEYKEKDKHF